MEETLVKKTGKSSAKGSVRLLCISLVLILLGSILACAFNTSFFSVKVTEIEFQTERGTLSALLYMPKGAGAEDPRPVVITTHGYLNTKEMQDAPSVEMSRRGYIVIDLDMYDHGDSRWAADIPVGSQFGTFWIYSMFDAANYAAQQPYTRKAENGSPYISVSGHSMGGFSSLVAMYMDEMQSLQTGTRNIYAGVAVGADFSYAAAVAPQDQLQAAYGSRTVGIIGGHYDEFFFNKSADEKNDAEKKIAGTVTYKDFTATTSGKAFLGFDPAGTPAQGEFYTVDSGAVTVEGTDLRESQSGLRVIYTPNQTHPWNHFSKTATTDLITFYTKAFEGATSPSQADLALDANNQIWMFKELFNCVALVGFFLFVAAAAGLLLKAPVLKLAVTEETEPLPSPATVGQKTAYWAAILFSILIPALLFATLMDKKAAGLIPLWIGALFLVSLGVIAALVGLRSDSGHFKVGGLVFAGASLLLFLVFFFADKVAPLSPYFVEPTTNQIAYWAIVSGLIAATLTIGFHYAVKKPAGATLKHYGVRFQLPAIAASLLVAVLAIGAGYVLLFAIQAVLGVDFRVWTLAVRTFRVEHLLVALRYLPLFFIYYFVNTLSLNANTRGRKGGYVIAILLNIGGLVCWLALQYGLAFATGVALYPAQALNGILLFALVPCLAVAAVYARKLYEKTNNVWLPAFLNTMLFTLISCANTALFFNMVAA
ncbi:Conserved membrane-spanning protein [uncultured Eubacteriales bacterium]|uniref:Conserved membrane-spanning protein n=1 Tax=uncultured Eubacteriales bacterium TaxID=172733 RepID=A0A212IW20_9FIRM|nr:Conserved membrane-spanning protein [uncultured Eubacteriales bacterium]